MEKILIVDDAELNREILKAIFEEQYEVLEAADGEEACHVIDTYGQDILIIFLDLRMPKKDGLEVLAHMRRSDLTDKIPVIMLTGEATAETDLKAYEYGADDVIYKPFAEKIVMRRAMNLIEQYQHRNEIESELRKRTQEVIDGQRQIEHMNVFLLNALGSVVEFRSLESGDHVKRVMGFTRIILDCIRCCYPEYRLTSREIELMAQASALHDVGKIAIPDDILKAPRKLTPEEFDEMKKHTLYGCEILERFRIVDNSFFKYCYDICRWHHEKIDGRGYPDGLSGDEIPIYCQAASIADCFDALVSKRVYKDSVDCQDAFDMIVRGECGAFSPVILDCFERSQLEFFLMVNKVHMEEQRKKEEQNV